jgi:GxxExxY protein
LNNEAVRQREAEFVAMPHHNDLLTEKVIGFAIEVHRQLGPGLLESAYEECLCYELKQNGFDLRRQVPLPVVYKSVRLDCGYRLDIVVENQVIVELKTVERLLPIHEAQLLTYMKLAGIRTGLLLNFNTAVLKDGIRRLML